LQRLPPRPTFRVGSIQLLAESCQSAHALAVHPLAQQAFDQGNITGHQSSLKGQDLRLPAGLG
jgi:hypothetical protein